MSDIVLVKQEVEMPKELKEIKDAVVEIVKCIKGKTVTPELLSKLMAAGEGYASLPAEVKDAHAPMAAAVLVAEVQLALRA